MQLLSPPVVSDFVPGICWPLVRAQNQFVSVVSAPSYECGSLKRGREHCPQVF